MRRLVLALACAAALASCGTVDNAISSKADQLAKLCRDEPAYHAAFMLIAVVHPLPASVVSAERQAHAAAVAICAEPPTDTVTALAALSDATAAVLDARATAEKETR